MVGKWKRTAWELRGKRREEEVEEGAREGSELEVVAVLGWAFEFCSRRKRGLTVERVEKLMKETEDGTEVEWWWWREWMGVGVGREGRVDREGCEREGGRRERRREKEPERGQVSFNRPFNTLQQR